MSKKEFTVRVRMDGPAWTVKGVPYDEARVLIDSVVDQLGFYYKGRTGDGNSGFYETWGEE